MKRLLGLEAEAAGWTVEFGHNSHELVTRLLSVKLAPLIAGTPTKPPSLAQTVREQQQQSSSELASKSESVPTERPGAGLRVLTSDQEFYSLTRQLNRLLELKSDRIQVSAQVSTLTPSTRALKIAKTTSRGILRVAMKHAR